MTFHRQLDDAALGALIDKARAEVSERMVRQTGCVSLVPEIVDRRLATHASIDSVFVEMRAVPERSSLLEPLRRALRRETSLLVTLSAVDGSASDQMLRDVDDVLSLDTIDCLMVATCRDLAVIKDVLGEALGTVLKRAGMQPTTGSPDLIAP